MKLFYYKVYHLDRAEVSSLWLTSQINVVVVAVLLLFYHTVLTVLFLHYTMCSWMALPLVVLQLTNLEIQNRCVSEYF